MPTNPTKPMSRRCKEAQRALEGIREQKGIAARLRRVGYGPERIEEGEAVLAGVIHAMEQVEETLAAQRAATRNLRRARAQLENSYRDSVQLAKVMLDDGHPWLEQADIPGRRARGAGPNHRDNSLEGLLTRARTFFKAAREADEAVQAQLREMGLGPTAIQMAQGLIGAVERAREQQQEHMAAYSEAVEIRSNAFETLDDWMRSFTTVARVALRDRPDLLKQLGVKPRGRPRKKGSEDSQATKRDG